MIKFLLRIHNFFYKFYLIIKNHNCKISTNLKISNEGIILLGKNISIERGCNFRIRKNSIIEIQDNVFIGKDVEVNSSNNIFFGENTTIQSRANVFGDVTILRNCIIGPNLYASSFSHQFSKDSSRLIIDQDKFSQISKPILINEDCFIGINVFIKPGVTIGRGCVVGANTNIITDLEPYSIVAGNPAKLINKRFNFFAKDEIYSNDDLDFPYFYSGFQKNNSINQLLVKNKNFCIYLDVFEKKDVILEIKSNLDSTLMFLGNNSQNKIIAGNSNMKFNIEKHSNNFLKFEIKEFKKNLQLEIISAKSK